MCGRYTIIAKAEEIEKRFEVEVPQHYTPRYNAAPTQLLPVITNEHPEKLSFYHWGLVPSWYSETENPAKLINARLETIVEKPSFAAAFKARRCLVISDGFYEWKRMTSKSKVPYRVFPKHKGLFAYAGLWEQYKNDDQTMLHSFAIITTEAKEATAHIHHRIPVILNPESEKTWLDHGLSAAEHLELLKSRQNSDLQYHPVSSLVNSIFNDDERLITPTPPSDQTGNYVLFS
jgi:putative SOS response-associated peptidase YedK